MVNILIKFNASRFCVFVFVMHCVMETKNFNNQLDTNTAISKADTAKRLFVFTIKIAIKLPVCSSYTK